MYAMLVELSGSNPANKNAIESLTVAEVLTWQSYLIDKAKIEQLKNLAK